MDQYVLHRLLSVDEDWGYKVIKFNTTDSDNVSNKVELVGRNSLLSNQIVLNVIMKECLV
jgi:hypothetical protein